MPFAVQDFRDLVQLLEERPEWRAEMRRLVLSDEYLTLPEQLAEIRREVAELRRDFERRFNCVEGRLDHLTNDVGQLKTDVGQLKTDVGRLTGDVEQLKTDVGRLTGDVGQLKTDVGRLTDDVGELKGQGLERRYREHAPSYFSRLIRRCRVVGSPQLNELLEDAVDRGVLSQGDLNDVNLADLILRGRRLGDRLEVMVLVEISWVIDRNDVRRAADRAALLAKLGTPVMAVVAGASITEPAATMARNLDVRQLLNGRVESPADRPENS